MNRKLWLLLNEIDNEDLRGEIADLIEESNSEAESDGFRKGFEEGNQAGYDAGFEDGWEAGKAEATLDSKELE